MTTNTGQGYQSCLEPVTGVEPACPAWEAGGLPLTYAGIVPVSPGCQAAASVFALTPMTSGCPASVFPSGFAVCQGLAPCGPTSGHGCAPCGRCIYMAKCRLAPLISLRSKRRNRIRKERPLGSGIPPAAAPSFRGVKKEKLHEVSRIEPSGQGISPEPCTTHGFGVGGTGGIRTHARLSSPVSFQDCSLIHLGTVPY